MILSQILAASLLLGSSLVSAAVFPKTSKVKMLDPKGFRSAMKRNETSVVAFVAPWCGHCQRMVPEYSKAAQSLYPLVPLYAVDCDEEANKALCSAQGVQGFPTVKLFPRGNLKPPVPYQSGERTAAAFFAWVSANVPNAVKRLSKAEDITTWVKEKSSKPRALLLNKVTKTPLLWHVLSNQYSDDLFFGSHFDKNGEVFASFGLDSESDDKKPQSRVVIYPAGSDEPISYKGATKYGDLSRFFKLVLAGNLTAPDAKPKVDLPDKKKSKKVAPIPEAEKVAPVPEVEKDQVTSPNVAEEAEAEAKVKVEELKEGVEVEVEHVQAVFASEMPAEDTFTPATDTSSAEAAEEAKPPVEPVQHVGDEL